MDHSYDKIYYTDSEDTQDMYPDMSVLVTELNTEADATFIDIVRGYPYIYAKNLKDFKDKNVRERSWVEIASVLNCSVEDCQRRWLRLRKFSKKRRLRDAETRSGSGSTTGRKEFSLYQNMMFLSEHIQSRKTYTNLHSANQQQPVSNAHAALSCILSSARTVQNPRSPISVSSPLLSPSSSESMPIPPMSSISSRNTPSPQIYIRQQSPIPQNIPLSRNSALLPIRNSTPSPSSHNFIVSMTSPQSILIPQSLSDFEVPTNPEASSQENISTSKRRSENMQEEQNNSFGGWIKKKDALTQLKQIF